MECPHLRDSVKVNRDFIKNKKCELSISSGNTRNSSTTNGTSKTVNKSNANGKGTGTGTTNVTNNKLWKCLECTSDKENWMCLNCGQVLCGRYQNGHALHHSTSHTQHNVCLNTLNCLVYCYKCDDYVTNETNLLDNLREEFKDDDSDASNSLDELLVGKTSPNQGSGSASASSDDSGWCEEGASPTITRRLRPRKRTNSNENESPAKKKILRKAMGIRNSGNTCFMNAVLQVLHNIHEFREYFNSLPILETKSPKRVYYSRSMKENDDDINVAEELRKLYALLTQGGDSSTKAISADSLYGVVYRFVPHFRGHRQHDAHEFLRYILDRLNSELRGKTKSIDTNHSAKGDMKVPGSSNGIESNSISSQKRGERRSSNSSNSSNGSNGSNGANGSIVTNVFGGTLQSEVRCLICGMESKKYDPFLDLSLDIPEKLFKERDSDGLFNCSIADCLSSFTEVEELNDTELYYCNSCKCKQKSTKRFWVRHLPNVLCLHIKRFRWNNFFRTKIDSKIQFPLESLDVSQYVLNSGPDTRRSNNSNNIYDLAAAVVHHGNGMSCGHYTSYVNHSGNWLHFNDQTVTEVSAKTVSDCRPYILFYSRRDANNSL